ncbi:SAFB-like transcription modulator isoform X2 [Episyrphus balteatus]|uniref:SAFB-like transcription modulator isoform X2 n=1 Tax=Episyrphus balteatus TaxID=286459 RepID=UPI00248516E5|nr:SAFB-like transcription modulator isoform X2 [Episyrphus balteatus]
MSDVTGKKLSELKVADLKDQLDKRSLEITGSKATLAERLEKALKEEGKDPSTYVFEKEPPKVIVKEEPAEKAVDEAEEKGDEEAPAEVDDGDDDDVIIDEVGEVDEEEPLPEEEFEEEEEETEDTQNTDTNMNDNEESINLTIEEDEQQLLHNEAQDDKDKTLTDESTTETNKSKNKEKDDSSEEKKTKSDTKKTDSEKEKKSSSSSSSTKEDSSKDDKTADKQKDESAETKSSSKSTSKDDKEKSSGAPSESSKSKTSSSSRNLWVSGLSSLTRASDLKTIFTKYGKVIGAKVVTNTRTPGTRCYGFVTMSSSSDASRCIDHLHRTELHGRIISVERTKNEIGSGSNGHSSTAAAGAGNTSNSSGSSKKKEEESKKASTDAKDTKGKATTDGADKKSTTSTVKDDKDKPKGGAASNKGADETKVVAEGGDRPKPDNAVRRRRNSRSGDRRRMDRPPLPPRRPSIDREERERERLRREREKERERREREILSYQKIREERERQRLRERERELREEERRRREIRERQREEELRLAEERRKLAAERERLEREKAELLRLERERQKLEREKIELERLELKRQQMKIIATSRIDEPPKRAVKRAGDERYPETTERKRNSGARFEAPPPPRFDASIATRVIKAIEDVREADEEITFQNVKDQQEWNKYEMLVEKSLNKRRRRRDLECDKSPWFTEECARLNSIKIIALGLYKKHKTPIAKKFHDQKRKEERVFNRRLKREHEWKLIEKSKEDFDRDAVYKN